MYSYVWLINILHSVKFILIYRTHKNIIDQHILRRQCIQTMLYVIYNSNLKCQNPPKNNSQQILVYVCYLFLNFHFIQLFYQFSHPAAQLQSSEQTIFFFYIQTGTRTTAFFKLSPVYAFSLHFYQMPTHEKKNKRNEKKNIHMPTINLRYFY